MSEKKRGETEGGRKERENLMENERCDKKSLKERWRNVCNH